MSGFLSFGQEDGLGAVDFDPDNARVHSLDGFRAVSAGLVVVAHYGLSHIVPGGLGVTIFFFISGFIITRLLLAEFDRKGTIDLAAFYQRRFWRLWPAIVAAVFGVVVAGLVFGEVWSPIGDVISCLVFMQNYWGLLSPEDNILGIHWSLAVEFHFYLIWPLALIAILSRSGLAVPATLAALLAFLAFRLWTAFALLLAGASTETVGLWTYQLSHLRGDSILFGCLLALMAYDPRWRRLLEIVAARWAIWLGVAVLLGTLVLRDEIFRATLRYSLQGAALFVIFAGVLFAERGGIVRWILNWPVMVWLGAISFSVYLWHMTIWQIVKHVSGREGLAEALIAGAATLLIAWLSYRFIELRFMRRRHAAKRRDRESEAAGVA